MRFEKGCFFLSPLNLDMHYRIKKIVVGISLACLLMWPDGGHAAETYVIDPDHSSITFRIKHLGITFVYGIFPNTVGVYTFDDTALENASIWIKVKVADIDTGNQKRDRDLLGPDFFNEEKFPFIIFKSVSITASNDDQYSVTGELTLHGVTKKITVSAFKTGLYQDPSGENRSGLETRFSVKRSDYGMKTMAAVADKVELIVSVEGVRVEKAILPLDSK